MIVQMSRIMVMGPKDLLLDTLSLIQQLGIMHIDTDLENSTIEEEAVTLPRLIDTRSALQHQYYENLCRNIEQFLLYIPAGKDISFDSSMPLAVDALADLLPGHIEEVKNRALRIEVLESEIHELVRYKEYLDTLGEVEDDEKIRNIDWIGVKLEKKQNLEFLQGQLEHIFEGKAVLEAVTGITGGRIAIVTTKKEMYGDVLAALQKMGMTVYPPPSDMQGLPLSEQKRKVDGLIADKSSDTALLKKEQAQFADRWLPRYMKMRNWVDSHLSLIKATASIVQTRMCFFIYGWLPATKFKILRQELENSFSGKVLVEESELAEKDFSRVPTALHNPAYFEPFELFTRLLPMPPYASFDLTPFIGIFFPIFFGMMLGDTGYGLLLLIGSIFLVRKFSGRKNIRDAGKILFISSLYTIVFGLLYGEFFGTLGHSHLGLEPLLINRHTSIIPLLCFAVAVGIVHVMIGLVLGVILALRRRAVKEASVKIVNIFIILCLTALAISYFMPAIGHLQKPLLVAVGLIIPALIVIGGLMAPLELLKNVGNIVSYARIMAIGLTSVLLANVANYMAGRTGSVWAGILVALLLHFFNILLGIFAPTIHSLRLHYVEFLSKFMEPGGREFKPLGGKK